MIKVLDFCNVQLYDGDKVIYVGEDMDMHKAYINFSEQGNYLITPSNLYIEIEPSKINKNNILYNFIIKYDWR